jgi:hypothetical protein
LRSAICATRSKGPRGPAVGYGPHRTIYLAGQTGIDANGKAAEGFRTQAAQGSELTALKPYGSAHFGPGVAMDTNYSD